MSPTYRFIGGPSDGDETTWGEELNVGEIINCVVQKSSEVEIHVLYMVIPDHILQFDGFETV